MGVNDWIRKHNAKVAAEVTQPRPAKSDRCGPAGAAREAHA
jgi:hypothetical protein